MQKWAQPGLVLPSGGQTAISYLVKQGDTAAVVCAVRGGGGTHRVRWTWSGQPAQVDGC